jgi:NADPH-dependent glutamate synthase beta subunit-like oxidoreductase
MAEAAIKAVAAPPKENTAGGRSTERLYQLADEILSRCRGEGPANCVARCPLHVNARGYVQLTKEGHYREALQLVREKLPFPGILGHICTHPCELHCKRIDEDSAVRIRDIKRFLAEWEPAEPQHILDCEPAKEETVAIVGSGPAGLIAAHDLKRQGYQVTVFERDTRIGGCLVRKLPPWRLPPSVTARDLSIISALGIHVQTGVEIGRDLRVAELAREFQAVLLLVGFSGGQQLLREESKHFRLTVRGTLWADPLTCETGIPGIFVAGDAVSGPGTVISALALGRRAAESAHRFLSGKDMRGNRESPLPSRLLWRLEVDETERQLRERTPVMLKPHNDSIGEAEAREEADRCLDCECGLCVKDCEFLAKHCRSPKDIARRIKEDLEGEGTLEMVYSCNICSLCATICPEDLDGGALLLEARRVAVSGNKAPLPQHKPILSYFNEGVSKTFSLLMPEPGRSRCKRLLFTGCALPAVSPKNTLRMYEELRRGYPGTGVLMYCCGAPVGLLGMDEALRQTSSDILRMAESLGAEELVTACPDCAHTLKMNVPELRVSTVWEKLAGRWQPPRLREGVSVSIHDSCKARHEPGIHLSVRKLIEDGGAFVEDIEYAGELARCCGLGGMIHPVDPDLSQRISRRRGDETPLPLVTYCASCRKALKSCGKDSIHILEFLLSPNWEKSARSKPPGNIPRYLNRLRTKWALGKLRPLQSRDRTD